MLHPLYCRLFESQALFKAVIRFARCVFQDKLLAKMVERNPDTPLDDDEEVRQTYLDNYDNENGDEDEVRPPYFDNSDNENGDDDEEVRQTCLDPDLDDENGDDDGDDG